MLMEGEEGEREENERAHASMPLENGGSRKIRI